MSETRADIYSLKSWRTDTKAKVGLISALVSGAVGLIMWWFTKKG